MEDDPPVPSCAFAGNHDLGCCIYPAAPAITIETFAKRKIALRCSSVPFSPNFNIKSSGFILFFRTACNISACTRGFNIIIRFAALSSLLHNINALVNTFGVMTRCFGSVQKKKKRKKKMLKIFIIY